VIGCVIVPEVPRPGAQAPPFPGILPVPKVWFIWTSVTAVARATAACGDGRNVLWYGAHRRMMSRCPRQQNGTRVPAPVQRHSAAVTVPVPHVASTSSADKCASLYGTAFFLTCNSTYLFSQMTVHVFSPDNLRAFRRRRFIANTWNCM